MHLNTQKAQSRFDRFAQFINQIQMTAFSGFIIQMLWIFGSVILTLVDAWLLTRQAAEFPLSSVDKTRITTNIVTLFSAHNMAAEQMRQVGLWLAGFLLTAWTGKTISNRFAAKDVRETAAEYAPVVEAKERGKAVGLAEAERITAEHLALKHHVTTVNADNAKAVTVQEHGGE